MEPKPNKQAKNQTPPQKPKKMKGKILQGRQSLACCLHKICNQNLATVNEEGQKELKPQIGIQMSRKAG